MLPLLLVMLLAASPASAAGDEIKVAGPSRVRASDFLLPAGASLRAATWENLPEKPTAPRHVALACLVLANDGAPISCVPATPKLKAATVGAWNALFDAYVAAAPTIAPGELALNEVAILRVLNSRLKPEGGSKSKTSWKLMLFDEVIAPSDERARPPAGEPLTMSGVTLERNFDPDVLRLLYPMIAQRYQMSARVTITCHIEPTLTLLCREPGRIDAEQGTPPENAQPIYTALVLASYQAASTIRLAPKARDGRDVAGKDLTMAFRWAMPAGETPMAAPAAAAPAAPAPMVR